MMSNRSARLVAAGKEEHLVIQDLKVGCKPRLAKKGVCCIDEFTRLLNANPANGK